MNSFDLGQALHVIGNDSAAGILKSALHLSQGQVLVSEDQFSYGPAPSTYDLKAWRSIREDFIRTMYAHADWPDFSFDNYADDGLLLNAERLASGAPVVVWTSCGLADQLFLSWVVFLFDQLDLDPSKISVVQFEEWPSGRPIMSTGLLNPEEIRDHHPAACQLDRKRADELRQAWAIYTNNDPSFLVDYINGSDVRSPLKTAMKQLVYRYPDVKTGLGIWDERLLHFTMEKGPRVVRAIGFTMGYGDTPDLVGDTYIFNRLLKLGSKDLAAPLVSISNPQSIRGCEAKLTAFGHDVLAGKASYLDENEIDDWVGGVHLSSREHIAFRNSDRLILP